MYNPLTPAGIEPATFRFVAQHLNHCANAVPSLQGRTEISNLKREAAFSSESSVSAEQQDVTSKKTEMLSYLL